MIREFQGNYRWLSNFAPVNIELDGRNYPSVEHAYMSAKSDKESWKEFCSDEKNRAGQVKKASRNIQLIDNWQRKKLEVMEKCVRQKFNQEPYKTKLLKTGNKHIQEGNRWGDKFWGVCLKSNEGLNHLGRLIMKVRSELNGVITQEQAEQMAIEHEEFLHSREYSNGDFDAQIGERQSFQDSDLSGIVFREAFLDEISFKGAKLHGTEFWYCTLTNAHFYEADLNGALFVECYLDRASFVFARCEKAKFIDCKIRDAKFRNANLFNAHFTGSDLENSDLEGVKISRLSDPDDFRNVNTTGIRNNDYVKRWMETQGYIAEFKVYHPLLAWFWKWSSDYGRSASFLIVWFVVGGLLFGSVYTFSNIVVFEKISPLSGYIEAVLMMIPFGYQTVIPHNLAGEIIIICHVIFSYGLLFMIGIYLMRRK